MEEKVKSKNQYDRRNAKTLLKILDADGALPKNYPVPVQVIHFGNRLTMLTMGGEMVADYSNDVMGCIPSLRVLREVGYEGGGAMRYIRSLPHPGLLDRNGVKSFH